MNITYARIRQRARQIVDRYPSPDFYQDYSFADELSRQYLETNPSTEKLQSFVAEHLEDNIDIGLAVGEELFDVIQREFADLL